MKPFRFYIAMFTGKTARLALRVIGRHASNFPGKAALKICPDFMKYAEKPAELIAVSGTNGKTTTTNLICALLRDRGLKVISNNFGSNTKTGIATLLVEACTMGGQTKYRYGVYEVDERSSRIVYEYIKPKYLLITNLSRDTIYRNAHPEYMFNFMQSAIPKETHLLLNADDLISFRICPENERTYFSIDHLPSDRDTCRNLINDFRLCPKCHAPLVYDYVRFHQIGKAHCSRCDFQSPKADFLATLNEDDWTFEMEGQPYKTNVDSVFLAYDYVAAAAMLRLMGFSPESISDSMTRMKPPSTRYIMDKAGGKKIISIYLKGLNPTATSDVMEYVSRESGTAEVVICLDDVEINADESENCCWLYDSDFEFLNKENIKHIIVSGKHGPDVRLRLLIAGVPDEKITLAPDEKSVGQYLHFDTGKIDLLHDFIKILRFDDARQSILKAVKEWDKKRRSALAGTDGGKT